MEQIHDRVTHFLFMYLTQLHTSEAKSYLTPSIQRELTKPSDSNNTLFSRFHYR